MFQTPPLQLTSSLTKLATLYSSNGGGGRQCLLQAEFAPSAEGVKEAPSPVKTAIALALKTLQTLVLLKEGRKKGGGCSEKDQELGGL